MRKFLKLSGLDSVLYYREVRLCMLLAQAVYDALILRWANKQRAVLDDTVLVSF